MWKILGLCGWGRQENKKEKEWQGRSEDKAISLREDEKMKQQHKKLPDTMFLPKDSYHFTLSFILSFPLLVSFHYATLCKMWTSACSQRSVRMVPAPTWKGPTCVPATGATAPHQTIDTVKVMPWSHIPLCLNFLHEQN